jgi:hypothetical protein
MFEPEGLEAVQLLQKKLNDVSRLLASAHKLRLCYMHAAALTLEREAARVEDEALVLALLCDFEKEAGL